MPLHSGLRLGPYEIHSPIGAGGMGEVYKAKDTRLARVVAIKVLPGHVAADSLSRERFEREAKAISSLNHPHICALYDVGNQDGIDFLVMEYVAGGTLADRIARGRLPLDEALHLARQIANALDAAHDRGIVHRDLKPDNIKVTKDGDVKVLDFGLAKVLGAASGRVDLSNASTLMSTTPGMILGTAAYMSPEQASGEEADRASDMWAFGCVLFEMLTGRRPFGGATTTEILANVLKTEPDWSQLPVGTPDGIRRLLRRSLQKDQKRRFRDMRGACLEMDEVPDVTSDGGRVTSIRLGRGERWWWASALVVTALVTAFLGARAFRPGPAAPEVRLDLNTPSSTRATLAISPDGRAIVFMAGADGQSRLWLRLLDDSAARPLAGTERASRPFWSADSRSIGFFANSSLKVLDLDGGSVRPLTASPVPLGGAWNRDGTIIFSVSPAGPILRIPASGGEPVAVTRLEVPGQRGHAFPQFLPDGRHFLFFVTGRPEARGIYVGQLDGPGATRLFDAEGPAVFSPTGHLLFVREGKLLAWAFDPDRLELRSDPFPVSVGVNAGTAVSASAAGPIVYQTPAPDSRQRQLQWVDRTGRETSKVIYAGDAALGPALSPDGRRIAVFSLVNENMDIWSYEAIRRVWERLTLAPGDDIYPLWSHDGASIVSGSVRKAHVDLYRTRLGAPVGTEELLFESTNGAFPMDWSPDGHFVLYDTLDSKRGLDLWALPLEGARTPFAIVQTDFNEGLGQFSPDGKWIAYQSDKTGRSEIYVRQFPGPGEDRRASIDGGTQVRWNPKGRELFYIGADDRLMAVTVGVSDDGKIVEPGTPAPLFATNVGSTASLVNRQQYVVSPDGQSFVMNSAVPQGNASPITVILNWRPVNRK